MMSVIIKACTHMAIHRICLSTPSRACIKGIVSAESRRMQRAFSVPCISTPIFSQGFKLDEGFRAFWESLMIATEPTETDDPGKRSLDDPPFGQGTEARREQLVPIDGSSAD